jgi:hypothetical protein
LTSLTAIFGRSSDDAGNSDKLLELYWNRAELKKEFQDLRNETFRLKDQIKEQKGHAARSQQQLLHLENLLLDPDWVHNVAVFYQFRALNAHLERKVARFAEQLKQQREQRQYRHLVTAWTEQREAAQAAIEADLVGIRDELRRADQELQASRHRYSTMNPILRFFRKRATKRVLDTLAATIEVVQSRERELEDRRAALAGETQPEVQGLDVQAKRSINCMILAFAQQVYLHYHEDRVAAMAREAGNRSAGAVRYGSKVECDTLMARIHRLRESMAGTADVADVLQQRTRLIAERARFADETEAVPDKATTGRVYDINESGQIRELDANLLRDNYWNVTSILSR